MASVSNDPFASEAAPDEQVVSEAPVLHEDSGKDIFSDYLSPKGPMASQADYIGRLQVVQSTIHDVKYVANLNAKLLGRFIDKVKLIEGAVKSNRFLSYASIGSSAVAVILTIFLMHKSAGNTWAEVDKSNKDHFEVDCEYEWMVSENLAAKPGGPTVAGTSIAGFANRGPVRFTASHTLGEVITSSYGNQQFFIDYNNKNRMGWAGMPYYTFQTPEIMQRAGFVVDSLKKRCL